MKTKTKTLLLCSCCLLLGSGSAFSQPNQPGSGNCLLFDGVDDWVNYSDDSFLPSGPGTEITIEFWASTTSSSGDIMEQWDKADNSKKSWDLWAGNPLRFRMNDYYSNTEQWFLGTSAMNDGRWHHCAITYSDNDNEVMVMVDGLIENTISTTLTLGPTTSSSYFHIGAKKFGVIQQYHFPGYLDEVRIWNYARSQSEIRRDMCRKLQGNEPGLVGYWRFDEGSGTTAFDSSSNNNDGTLY